MGPFMGARCRILFVPDDDNVYIHPAVIRQVINDLEDMAREESRKVECSFCKFRFVPLEIEGEVRCPRCRNAPDQGDQD